MLHQEKRVVWTEGMLLKPQQFQQMEQYLEWYTNIQLHNNYEDRWGLSQLTIEEQYFPMQRFGISQASGIFPDGTPFKINSGNSTPLLLDVPENTSDKIIYLALALQKDGIPLIDMQSQANTSGTRFRATQLPLADNTVTSGMPTPINLAIPKLHLLLEGMDCSQYATIPIAKIKTLSEEKGITLDKTFIPPLLNCQADLTLSALVYETFSLLAQRSKALSQRILAPSSNTVADMREFLLLQIINRNTPLFAHFAKCANLHPKMFYQNLIQLVGELETFNDEKAPDAYLDEYCHNSLATTFSALMQKLRISLNQILDHRAQLIELLENNPGIHIGAVHDQSLMHSADFILAVRADMAEKRLQKEFIAQCKVAPIDKINAFVEAQVPGIRLRSLSVAPPQIPYHAGFTYYRLDDSHDLWQQTKQSGGVALHVGGIFENLQLELWAIKR